MRQSIDGTVGEERLDILNRALYLTSVTEAEVLAMH